MISHSGKMKKSQLKWGLGGRWEGTKLLETTHCFSCNVGLHRGDDPDTETRDSTGILPAEKTLQSKERLHMDCLTEEASSNATTTDGYFLLRTSHLAKLVKMT